MSDELGTCPYCHTMLAVTSRACPFCGQALLSGQIRRLPARAAAGQVAQSTVGEAAKSAAGRFREFFDGRARKGR